MVTLSAGLTRNSHIKYTVDLDIPSDGSLSANRCNCTFCQKPGLTNIQPPDASTFKLLSPASRSELGDYNPNARNAHKYFCKTCGCHVFAEGEYPWGDQMIKFFNINVASIDQPQEGLDVSKVKLSYCDGLNDNWAAGLKEAPFASGLP